MKTLLFCLATLPVLAQQPHPVVKTAIVREAFTADTPPERQAEVQTKALASQLSLSPKQVEQVRGIALANARAYQAMLRRRQAGNESGVSISEESEAINQQFEIRLAAICTPAQRKQRQLMLVRIRHIRTHFDSLDRARAVQK